MTDLVKLNDDINTLAPDLPVSKVIGVMNDLDYMAERIRELRGKLEARVIDWINVNGRIDVGTIYYHVGTKKRTTCQDIPGTIEAVLNKCNGDVGTFASLLAAQPFRYGGCKRLLDAADYDRLFVTTETKDLATGVLKKELCRGDTRYVTG